TEACCRRSADCLEGEIFLALWPHFELPQKLNSDASNVASTSAISFTFALPLRCHSSSLQRRYTTNDPSQASSIRTSTATTMGQFTSQPRDDTSPPPDPVLSLSQGTGGEQGIPVITRIRTEGGKTATVTITLQATALTSALASTFTTSSLLPVMTTLMTTLRPSLTTSTLSSTEQNTSLPKSTGSPDQEPHVTLSRNTLIIISCAAVGGSLLLLFLIGMIHAYVRRRDAIKEDAKKEAAAAAGIQERELNQFSHQPHQHANENGYSMAMSQPAARACSEPDLYQHFHPSHEVANASFRTLPAANPAYEPHPAQVVAELPAEPCRSGLPHYGYRG
ncbi:uncharacterized protein CCOS01_14534, partial [Colletotrichum costaricense]